MAVSMTAKRDICINKLSQLMS